MLANTRLVSVSRFLAEEFMQKHEHLRNVGLGVWHWGLDLEGRLAGVVSYGTPCFSNKRGWLNDVARDVNCGIIQLCRGGSAHWSPKATASHLICLANKAMYRLRGPILVVAYADPTLCEIGTIYQACNAIYTGLTEPKGQANYMIHGRKLSGWQVRKLYGTRSRAKLLEIDPNYEVLPLNRKHRYIMLAAPRQTKSYLRKLLIHISLPYPKRDKEGVGNMVVS